MVATLNTKQIQDSFISILGGLTEKEHSVITRRIGLGGEKETLQAIGNTYGITRERVRQIEDVGIKKIGRIVRSSALIYIQETAEKILSVSGGLMTKDKLVEALIEEIRIDKTLNEGILEVIVQSDFNIQKSKPQIGTQTYFYTPEIQKKLIGAIHKEAISILKKKGDIMETAALYEIIKANLASAFGKVETCLIDGVMDIFDELVKGEEKYIGLTKWKILNPSTLKDKAIYVFKKEKNPIHFVELANKISNYFGEAVKVATIHNELIRNNEFVLIGRGIYVLKEWGYKPGTVLDVIMDIFQKAKVPLSTEEIIARVLKTRQVKTSTIYMNLQNKQQIERVGRNMYQLKQN
ncbi:MAG: sigma factor-like helix-turn-helix DNA-binding protein [Candidatus Gracilibacteria bacterium]|nr:sigma factor-like helix-turn-helix DNA-binding protein [Candidatus Gracilibacteria bacterium]